MANKEVATGNGTLSAANPGDIFLVTLNNPIFIVDLDEFFNNASLPSSTVTTLFSGEASLVNGQDVMVHVTAATGAASTGNQAITSDRVRLRFTRTTGTVQTVSGQSFSISNLPPFIPFVTNPLVDTITGATNFDGVTDISGVTVGQTVSIRALLLNNSTFSFYAAKVRVYNTDFLLHALRPAGRNDLFKKKAGTLTCRPPTNLFRVRRPLLHGFLSCLAMILSSIFL